MCRVGGAESPRPTVIQANKFNQGMVIQCLNQRDLREVDCSLAWPTALLTVVVVTYVISCSRYKAHSLRSMQGKSIDLLPDSMPSSWPANYSQWAVYFSLSMVWTMKNVLLSWSRFMLLGIKSGLGHRKIIFSTTLHYTGFEHSCWLPKNVNQDILSQIAHR